MSGSLGWLGRLPLLAAGCMVLVGPAAGCAGAGPGGPAGQPSRAGAGHSRHAPSRPRPSSGMAAPFTVPAVGGDPARLAGQLSTAERALGVGAAAPADLGRQALIVQLACLRAAAHPGWAGAVLAKVAPAQRAAATGLAATADLVALAPPRTRLPRWRIAAAQSPAALRADYQAAQAATGVAWVYLAAINCAETDFGRAAGPSTAGAQGPMQFLPATWASYGHGSLSPGAAQRPRA